MNGVAPGGERGSVFVSLGRGRPRALTLALLWVGMVVALGSPGGARTEATVMVVVAEKVAGVFGTTGFEEPRHVEGLLAAELDRRGFRVLDLETVERRIGRGRARQLLEGNEVVAREVALAQDADYVILGSATSKPAGTPLFGTNMQSLQAHVSVRFVRADGRIVGAATGRGSQAHLDEVQGGILALTEATEEVTEALSAAFDEAAQERGRVAADVGLQIQGLVSYRHLDFLMGFLQRELRGVRDAKLRSFQGGLADIGLDVGTDAESVARQLESARFTGFRLRVGHVSPSLIEVEAILEE